MADALRYCIKKHASTLTTAPEDSDASQDESSSASSSSESEASDLDSEAGPLSEEDSDHDADLKAQRQSQDGLAGFSGRAGSGLRAPASAQRSRGPREGSSRLVIVIAAAEAPDDVSTSLRRCFTHEVVLEPPDEGTRTRILSRSLGIDRADPSTAEGDADEMSRQQLLAALKVIALQTVGAVPRDLRAIAADAGVIAVSRRQNGSREAEPSSGLLPGSEYVPISRRKRAKGTGGLDAEVRVTAQDLEAAFARAKTRTASAIGTPKVRKFMRMCADDACRQTAVSTSVLPGPLSFATLSSTSVSLCSRIGYLFDRSPDSSDFLARIHELAYDVVCTRSRFAGSQHL